MKEIVEKIVKQEEKARNEVENAKEEAKKKLIEAEQQADKIIKDIQENCKQKTKELLKQAKKDALIQKEEQLHITVKSADTIWRQNPKEFENIIEKLFKLIIDKGK